jgi:methyl-accepting chemotaxis protein
MEDDDDIERQHRDVAAAPPPPHKMCGLSVFNIVGSIANVIRTIICICLLASVIIIILIAAGVFVDWLISSKILYVVAFIGLIGVITIAFDSSTSQWLIQKVLNQLSHDVSRLETSLDHLDQDLKTSAEQLKKRDEQLVQSAAQIKKQDAIVTNLTVIQNNMSALVTSLMNANADGADLNAIFAEHLKKFEQQLERLEKFADAYVDHNNNNKSIDFNEFQIYISQHPRYKHFNIH